MKLTPEQVLEEALKLLKEVQPFFNNGSAVFTEAVYITPAEQLRRRADHIEYKEDLGRRLDAFLSEHIQ